jgi:hypothetical protein
LALFGRRPPQRVDSLVMPASENLHNSGSDHYVRSPRRRARALIGRGARLQQIAKKLSVDIPFFYDVDRKQPAVNSLLVLNSVFSLRLMRAYTAIKDQAVQRQLVILVEMIAASQH